MIFNSSSGIQAVIGELRVGITTDVLSREGGGTSGMPGGVLSVIWRGILVKGLQEFLIRLTPRDLNYVALTSEIHCLWIILLIFPRKSGPRLPL